MAEDIVTHTLGNATQDASSWKKRAACRGCGPDLFFGDRGDTTTAAQAKMVCSTCEVTKECLQEWRSLPSDWRMYGIWGGTGDWDRKRMK